MLVQVVGAALRDNPAARLKLHVDDLSMTARGDTDQEAATEIGAAAADMVGVDADTVRLQAVYRLAQHVLPFVPFLFC